MSPTCPLDVTQMSPQNPMPTRFCEICPLGRHAPSKEHSFAELAEGPAVPATAGRCCTIIPKRTKVVVGKRTGSYDCVRYKGQPPAHYERTCI